MKYDYLKSIRFCNNCDKKTRWKYEQPIGHSVCQECGFRNIGDEE